MPSASAATSASATGRAFSGLVRLLTSAVVTRSVAAWSEMVVMTWCEIAKWRIASKERAPLALYSRCAIRYSLISSAAVQLREHELAVAKRLGGSEAAVGGAHDHVDEGIARLIERHLAAQDAGHVDVDVLRHGAHRARIAADLDDWQDRIADDVALAGGEGVDDIAGCR